MYKVVRTARAKKLEVGDTVWVDTKPPKKLWGNAVMPPMVQGVGEIIRLNIYHHSYVIVMDGEQRSQAIIRKAQELKLIEPHED